MTAIPSAAASITSPGSAGALLLLNSSNTPLAMNVAASAPVLNVYQLVVISVGGAPGGTGGVSAPSGGGSPGAALRSTGREWAELNRWFRGSLMPVAYELVDSFSPFPSATFARPALPQSSPSTGPVTYSIVSNGKSSGQALELQVLDPSGKVQQVAIPQGMVLEPVTQGSAQPVSQSVPSGAKFLTRPLTAYCLEFAKLPPEAGMLYRIAPQALQDKYQSIRAVLQAGRESAAARKLHPDNNDLTGYADDILQYAVWSKLDNWGQQKFSEMFIEHTKKNAQAMKVTWTKQMEQAVLNLAPGRWRDISMVLDEAQELSNTGASANEPKP